MAMVRSPDGETDLMPGESFPPESLGHLYGQAIAITKLTERLQTIERKFDTDGEFDRLKSSIDSQRTILVRWGAIAGFVAFIVMIISHAADPIIHWLGKN
jgi:hypothetical protein